MTPPKTRKKPAPAKGSTKAPVSKAAVVNESKPQVLAPELKKKELIDLVVEKSAVSKKYAKPVVEAMLEVLGETFAEGREMNLQPLGKVKYNRIKEMDNARIVILKLRQNKAAAEGAKTAIPAPKA
jgi:DNA-binding protein HU-alpha